jgi:ferrous iron transport protein B
MTCSARLPIYTLMIGALFPPDRLWGVVPVQGLLMVFMYLFSVVMALSAAWVLSRTVLKAPNVALVLELPPYRAPRLRDVLRMMTSRASMFLREAGTVILGFTILLWALLSFPKDVALTQSYDAQIAVAASEAQVAELTAARDGELLRGSYGGRLGHALEPVIQPLGFDWKIGVGLIGAFAAREVFVSTMGVVYGVGGDVNEESVTLRERMRSELRDDGKPVYTPLVGMSLMAFFALACQCMSTLAVVKRETGGWRWPTFLFVYMTSLAWTVSFVIYQGGRLLGFAG